MKKNVFIHIIGAILLLVSCADDDTFSAAWDNVLTFECDTLSLDTCFSTVPTPHKMMYVYNNSGDGIRISGIRLENGNQTGFRINVNGTYLSDINGFQTRDMELRRGDSLRIFVELTSNLNGDTIPKLVEDNLVFNLESGRMQKVNFKAWSWDATLLTDYYVGSDTTTILQNEHGKPVVVNGRILVDKDATLQIEPGTTIYFHNGAGIDVKGSIKINGEKDKEVTLRCDRLDWMVSNLMYDNNPGQWDGIHLCAESFDNEIRYADIHACTTALMCDSAYDSTRQKLTVSNSTLHNMKGSGIRSTNCNISIENTQISNACENCLYFLGGKVYMNNCTVAQYYPFDANRGEALFFANGKDGVSCPLTMQVENTIVKGYADDVITWSHGGTEDRLDVLFNHCLLRTIAGDDYEYMFKDCIMETAEDAQANAQNSFLLFDTNNFYYDFTPTSVSQAVGAADVSTALPIDRKGRERSKDKPDIGCYETEK